MFQFALHTQQTNSIKKKLKEKKNQSVVNFASAADCAITSCRRGRERKKQVLNAKNVKTLYIPERHVYMKYIYRRQVVDRAPTGASKSRGSYEIKIGKTRASESERDAATETWGLGRTSTGFSVIQVVCVS